MEITIQNKLEKVWGCVKMSFGGKCVVLINLS